MSTLSKKAIEDFKKLYFQEFGVKLTDSVAKEKALKFLHLYKLIFKNPCEKD